MSKTYKGSLTLEWYNKQKSILLADEQQLNGSEIPAPRINWVNKDEALFYEVVEDEGRGLRPYWVDRNDIRVKEARPLIHQKTYKAIAKDKPGTLAGMDTIFEVEESTHDDPTVENTLIKGDNLLALNTLKKTFDNKLDDEKVKCIFIDPPYNTGYAFEQYDDNLAHSEWLTLMRDRLVLLRDILATNGSIWITIDDKEAHYLKVLLDEIFGYDNFVANAIWEKVYSPRMDAKDFSVSHDHLLVYQKTDQFMVNKVSSTQNDKQFSKFDANKGKYYRPRTLRKEGSGSLRTDRPNMFYPLNAPDGTMILPIRPDGREGRWRQEMNTYLKTLEEGNIEWILKDGKWEVIVKQWKEENPVQPPVTYWDLKDTLDDDFLQVMLFEWLKSENKLDKLLKEFTANVHDDLIFRSNEAGHNHEAKEEIKQINPDDVFATPKPEKLIQLIFSICTKEGDLILDCFGGSGSSFSVAHKMERKWIGIEMGEHIETHIIPRIKSVLDGTNQMGISKSQNWQGGGSFKYFHLGPSIIATAEDGMGDFNWALGAEFIQESLLSSYDYTEVTNLQLPEQLYALPPKIGVQKVGNHTRVGIISLNPPKGDAPMMSYDEIKALYDTIKSALNPNYINMFTNRGIEIAADSKPDDLEIIKVPHAIFAELEK